MYKNEAKEKVIALAKANWSIADIVEETQVSRPTVYRWLSEAGMDDENEPDANENFENQEMESQNEGWIHDNTMEEEDDFQEEEAIGEADEEDWQEDLSDFSHFDVSDLSQNRLNSQNTFSQHGDKYFSGENPAEKKQKGYDPEVEKLRLELAFKLKFEKLRQHSRAMELEEQRLHIEELNLQIQQQQLSQQDHKRQQEALQQAKARDQAKQKLLKTIKKKVHAFREDCDQYSFTEDELEQYYESFEQLQQQVEEVADSQEELWENWQVWRGLESILEMIVDARQQLSRSFFKTDIELSWEGAKGEVLQSLMELYALDQELEDKD